ncbi:unnamed protein product [Closterium sp. Naga37s-1]|nr:unnamed protein product [Closterium sp. Naga37s-1]
MAEAWYNLYDLGKAWRWYHDSLGLNRRLKIKEGEFIALIGIGNVSDARLQHEQALEYFQQALLMGGGSRERGKHELEGREWGWVMAGKAAADGILGAKF